MYLVIVLCLFCLSGLVSCESIHYELVFKGVSGKAGGSGSIYNLWSYYAISNTDVAAAKEIGSGFTGHYKSPVVDKWDTTSFTKVKLAVYTGGTEAKYFVFSASGSTKMSWMSKDRFLEGSYDFTGANFNYFSIQGSGGQRHFFINRMYAGCDHDYGWLVVSDRTTHGCLWENQHEKPAILYSSHSSNSVNWLNGVAADEMAIYFGRPASTLDPCLLADPSVVPNLQNRGPYHVVSSVFDDDLEANWYSSKEYDIVTTELSAEGIKCGASKYIWMEDKLPSADEQSHNRKVCVADSGKAESCSTSFQIKMKNCGTRYMYYLEKPTVAGAVYCFDISQTFNPCSISDPTTVPDLEERRPVVTEISINDDKLQTGWYTSLIFDIYTFKPTSVPACGTNYPIWMSDSVPNKDDQAHLREVCIADGSVMCQYKHYIHIRNCGNYRMYHLTAPSIAQSSYCYDIKTDSNEPAPDFEPAYARIEYELRWENYLRTEKPHLLFRCSFEVNDKMDLFYSVFFYVDDTFLQYPMVVKASNKNEAFITEESLANFNDDYKLGLTISCRVGARATATGQIGNLVASEGFYAGIKMLNKTVTTIRGQRTGTFVHFYPTVPFGCMYSPWFQLPCEMDLRLINVKSTEGCYDNAIASSQKCTAKIKGVTKTEYYDPKSTNNWQKTYAFEIQHADTQELMYYLRNRQIKIQFVSPEFVPHNFWKLSYSEEATIDIREPDVDYWMKRKCEIYCDPHMLTFDRVRYELQFGGIFTALKHDTLPIEVQVEIAPCYHNNRAPYCVCGIAVRAGRDVFLITTCDGLNKIDFELCEDSVLKAVNKKDNTYRIYLPTGAIVEARRRKFAYPNIWDVDIRPTLHEMSSVTGLCGNMDNKNCNDISPNPPGNCKGGYYYHPNTFSESHKIDESRNLLRPRADVLDSLQSFPSAVYQVCICPSYNRFASYRRSLFPFTVSNTETKCSYREYAACDNGKRDIKCIIHEQHAKRKRRSAQTSMYDAMSNSGYEFNREKRSTGSMSEADARVKCEAALKSSQTYEICGSLGLDATDGEIENCVLDLMASGDERWIDAAQDRSSSSCLTEIASNITMQSENEASVSLVQNITCPNNCSNLGTCLNGECVCSEGFAADDCSFNMSAPLHIIGLSNDGLCDLKHSCDAVYINGQDFPSDRQFTCQFKTVEVKQNGSKGEEEIKYINGSQRTVFQLECKLPEYEIPNDTFAFEHQVAVKMDDGDMSDDMPFVVLDSTCQQYNITGQAEFSMKNGFCFITGGCVSHATSSAEIACYECNSYKNLFEWHPSSASGCSVYSTDEADNSVTWKIAVGVTAGVVLIGVTILNLIMYLKASKAMATKVTTLL